MVGKKKLFAVAFLSAAIPAGAEALAAGPEDCSCRTPGGQSYSLGQVTCIKVDQQDFLARCEMNLNVTTWTKLNNGCAAALPEPEAAGTGFKTICAPWHTKASLN